jgi:hypothetical protein
MAQTCVGAVLLFEGVNDIGTTDDCCRPSGRGETGDRGDGPDRVACASAVEEGVRGDDHAVRREHVR